MEPTTITSVKGVITTSDGQTREFEIVDDGGWMQWGNSQERLGDTVDALNAMAQVLMEDGHLEGM